MKTESNNTKYNIILKAAKLWDNTVIKLLSFILLALFIIIFPKIVSLYILRIAVMLGFYLVLSLALNITTGYLGQVSLGIAAFYAIGAYATVLLTKECGMGYALAVICGACITAIFGLVLALATMRLSGTYLAIVTLAFFYVVMNIIMNWESLTRGPAGIYDIPPPTLFGIKLTLKNGGIFYLIMFYFLLVVFVTHLIVRSKIGRAFKAIRDDSMVSTMMGIDNKKYKIIAYVISAFFAGLAGTLYGPFLGYINNHTFTYDMCITSLAIVILGGMGTTKGVIIGAIILSPLSEVLRAVTQLMKNLPEQLISNPEQWRFVLYGAILVLMMRFRPQGIIGGQSKLPYKMPKGVIRKGNQ